MCDGDSIFDSLPIPKCSTVPNQFVWTKIELEALAFDSAARRVDLVETSAGEKTEKLVVLPDWEKVGEGMERELEREGFEIKLMSHHCHFKWKQKSIGEAHFCSQSFVFCVCLPLFLGNFPSDRLPRSAPPACV
ncbi:Hypothetical protein NTJ_07129 [Nesidiocoris tenuis]|uniref:Uncharacterized protein n=1 Tax=Nesidiocoris tenuis TaxID=355587 RepID=A0ABN7ATS4_9HEMI|nr:Hypothetical protein NTJ_07129 [Nesidiocoris tenuis]